MEPTSRYEHGVGLTPAHLSMGTSSFTDFLRQQAPDLLPGRSPARQVYAVARESGVRRPSVAVILTALTAAARTLSRQQGRRPADSAG